MPLRLATFNVENLLQRFDFYAYGNLVAERTLSILGVPDDEEGMILRKSLHVVLTEDTRQMTGQAIREVAADIVCLQEVDNLQVLRDFHDYYLQRAADVRYGWLRLVEGNDNRGIDVAVMSKEWIKVTSHAEHTFHDFGLFNKKLEEYGEKPGDRIFRRDCLEVDTKVDGKDVALFICHLKSMSGGREETKAVREAEAAAVRKIVVSKYGSEEKAAKALWAICGDLNDYFNPGANGRDPASSLNILLSDGFSRNIVENMAAKDRWTHYYAGDRTKNQIDYILLSPALYALNKTAKPKIIRGGQPYRVPDLETVPRYPRVGFDRPKASDHCPLTVTLKVKAG